MLLFAEVVKSLKTACADSPEMANRHRPPHLRLPPRLGDDRAPPELERLDCPRWLSARAALPLRSAPPKASLPLLGDAAGRFCAPLLARSCVPAFPRPPAGVCVAVPLRSGVPALPRPPPAGVCAAARRHDPEFPHSHVPHRQDFVSRFHRDPQFLHCRALPHQLEADLLRRDPVFHRRHAQVSVALPPCAPTIRIAP